MAAEKGISSEVERITNMEDIASSGVLFPPALVINGKIVSDGRVSSRKEIRHWLEKEE